MRRSVETKLSESEVEVLERFKHERRVLIRLGEREAIVTHVAAGLQNQQITETMGITQQNACRWGGCYAERELAGIERDTPRLGRRRGIGDELRAEDVCMSIQWASRRLHALEPSDDAGGDRTQPSSPMKRGRCGTMTHEYMGIGTTSLFAALRTIISACYSRHRRQEWLRFLDLIKSSVPEDAGLHLICANDAMHKRDKVEMCVGRHPRCRFYFMPTSASWLNMVERLQLIRYAPLDG